MAGCNSALKETPAARTRCPGPDVEPPSRRICKVANPRLVEHGLGARAMRTKSRPGGRSIGVEVLTFRPQPPMSSPSGMLSPIHSLVPCSSISANLLKHRGTQSRRGRTSSLTGTSSSIPVPLDDHTASPPNPERTRVCLASGVRAPTKPAVDGAAERRSLVAGRMTASIRVPLRLALAHPGAVEYRQAAPWQSRLGYARCLRV